MKKVPKPRPPRTPAPFWVEVGRGLGQRVQRLPYADDELLVSLGNSLRLHEQAVRQSRSLWGRLTAVFAGRLDPKRIEIDGTRLKRLLALAGATPPGTIDPDKVYAVEIARFRELLRSVTESLTAED